MTFAPSPTGSVSAAFPGAATNSTTLNPGDYVGTRDQGLTVNLGAYASQAQPAAGPNPFAGLIVHGSAPTTSQFGAGLGALANVGLNAAQEAANAPPAPTGNLTIAQALQALGQMEQSDPAALGDLQRQLYAGHFYSSTYYTRSQNHTPIIAGQLDDPTIRAFAKALMTAAHSGKPVDEIIRTGDQTVDITGSGSTSAVGKGSNLHATLSNPDTVAMAADAAAQKFLGRNAPHSEKAAILKDVQGQEMTNAQGELSASNSAYEAQFQNSTGIQASERGVQNAGVQTPGAAPTAGTPAAGGNFVPGQLITTTGAPNPTDAAAAYFQQNNQPEYQAHALVDAYNTFQQIMQAKASDSGAARPANKV